LNENTSDNIITENIDNEAVENTTEHSRQEDFTKLSDSIKGLSSTGKPYDSFIARINAFDRNKITDNFDEDVRNILKDLESDEALFALAFDLKEQDRQNHTNTFASFVESASKFEPSLQSRLIAMKPKLQLAL
jgi:hypothetical protein